MNTRCDSNGARVYYMQQCYRHPEEVCTRVDHDEVWVTRQPEVQGHEILYSPVVNHVHGYPVQLHVWAVPGLVVGTAGLGACHMAVHSCENRAGRKRHL